MAYRDSEILVVEDNFSDLHLLVNLLSNAGYRVRVAQTGKLAIASVQTRKPGLVMLDIKLPDMDGYTLGCQLQSLYPNPSLPIIFVSALDESECKVRAFKSGGVDYLTKPYQPQEVLARVKLHLTHAQLQRQLEAQNDHLREHEERWQLMMRGTGDGIFDWNIQTGTLLMSAQYCTMLGYNKDELCPHVDTWKGLLHPVDRDQVWRQLQAYLNRRISEYAIEYRLRCKSGGYKWIFARGQAVWNGTGKPLRMVGTHQDIDDRKQAESALRYSEQKFRTVFDTIASGLLIISPLCGLLEVNDTLCQMLGYSESELLAMEIEDLIDPTDCRLTSEVLKKLCFGELSSYQIEQRFLTKNGRSIWGLFNATIMETPGQVLYTIAQIVDISSRKAIEQMKDDFISTVSHELRTPLTSIQGSLLLLSSGLYDNQLEQKKKMLEIATQETVRLVRLVNDILDLQRLESGQIVLVKESCNVADLIAQSVAVMEPLATQEKVTVVSHEIEAKVWAAHDAIVQTLTNLIGNAIKFSEPDSEVKVIAQLREKDVLFVVRDWGCGIPEDKQKLIFERFQQVDMSDRRKKGGTGLGLSICQNIVHQHEGKIWVESRTGEGSSFYFTLPRV
ncbi:MAG: PAS domain S-box protein [Limnospira sp.]